MTICLVRVDVAISGMRAQNQNISAIYSNVANARTTDAGDGLPYRRIEAIFRAQDEELGGVEIQEMAEDQSDFEQIFNPGHPSANDEGYVSMPNVDVPTEMINLNIATRAYQANAALLKRYQTAVDAALELLR